MKKETKEISIELIKPYWNNPRDYSDSLFEIVQSIRDFGFNQPIILDEEGTILAGHARYQAAKVIGLQKIPVIFVDIPEEKAREYRILDNRTAEESMWNEDLLRQELAAIDDGKFTEDYFPELNDEMDVGETEIAEEKEEEEKVVMCPYCDTIIKYDTNENENSVAE